MSQTIPSAASLDPANEAAEIIPSVDSVLPARQSSLHWRFSPYSEGFRSRFYANPV
jgi:hypothetical protein